MSEQEVLVPIRLEGGVLLYVEAREGGEVVEGGGGDELEETAFSVKAGLKSVTDAIRAVGQEIADAYRAVGPDTFTVELGFDMKAEQGGVVALFVKAGGSASIKVTMEWKKG